MEEKILFLIIYYCVHTFLCLVLRSGQFCSKDLPYLALDIQATKKWNVIRTELDVSDGELSGIDDDYERCYMMIKIWLNKNGKRASYEKLAEVLKRVGLSAIRTNYCLEGNHPPSQEIEDIHTCKLLVSVIPKMCLNVFWFVQINRYGLFMGRRHKRPPRLQGLHLVVLCVVLCIFSAITASMRTIEAV